MSPATVRSPAWIAAVIIAAGASACGASSSQSTANSSNAGRTSVVSSAQFKARVNLAKCLRAHGVNVPDPTPATSRYGRALLRLARNYPQAQLSTAEQSCKQYIFQGFPQLALSPAQQAQRLRQEIQYAECMRSHHVNIADPTTGAPGQGLALILSSINRDSPAFKAANTACANLRPRRTAATGAPAAGG